MPLFLYECADCKSAHEVLVRNGEAIECPKCHSTNMTKQLSRFNAVSAGAPAPEPMGCGAPACCQLTGQGCAN